MRRTAILLVGLVCAALLLPGTATRASAQEIVRTFMFQPVPDMPWAMSDIGIVMRVEAVSEAIEDTRLLGASGAVATQVVEPVVQPMVAWLHFGSLEPDNVYSVVAIRPRPDGERAVELLCQFRVDHTGRGECNSHWTAALEPTDVEVRHGGLDGRPVMRGF